MPADDNNSRAWIEECSGRLENDFKTVRGKDG